MGIDSFLVEELVRCCQHDQCTVGNGGHEACVPRCAEIPPMPDSCGRLLRVETNWEDRGFEVNEGELFAFAGIWDRWKDPSGNWMKTSSILTTTPNAVTSAFHNRSPASHPMSCGTCLAKLTSL
jgi:hypothetical protein